ncbi:MAG TPA: EAL domain-containing protein [Candidatus Limnocylindrales bacterium]|nr:EAL domain-containing protein [Candidatus Limnocylindrales bacterium]
MSQQTLHDPSGASEGSDTAGQGAALRLVRIRLALVVVATAMVSAAASGTVAIVATVGPGGLFRSALGILPIPWVLLVPAILVVSVWLIRNGTRRVLELAAELDLARHHVGSADAGAGSDTLVDTLTGLGNHRAFQEELDRQLDAVRRYGHTVALVFIDLDDFKVINDAGGHALGDKALALISKLLRGGLRRSDRPFRIGGDEFAVLMPGTRAEDAQLVMRRVLSSCVEPRRDAGFERGISFSAGIASAPDMGIDRSDLYARADDALYEAKREGRTAIRVFDPSRDDRPLTGERLARAARAVIELVARDAVSPVYQPIVDLQTGLVSGFEGLSRPDPQTAFEDAGSLFTVAEQSGRTADLDWVCIRSIIAGAGTLEPDQSLSLNLSPMTIEAPEFQPLPLLGLLSKARIPPDRIILEITERQGIDQVDTLRAKLNACRAAGFKIAIDDLGAGNSGLRLLSQIQFDIVKIDLSLVQAGTQREASLDIVRTLMELATRWGAYAVAEGVETLDQLQMLRAIGVGHAQGYLLGRPMTEPKLRQVDLETILGEQGSSAILRALAAASV